LLLLSTLSFQLQQTGFEQSFHVLEAYQTPRGLLETTATCPCHSTFHPLTFNLSQYLAGTDPLPIPSSCSKCSCHPLSIFGIISTWPQITELVAGQPPKSSRLFFKVTTELGRCAAPSFHNLTIALQLLCLFLSSTASLSVDNVGWATGGLLSACHFSWRDRRV
jgi:hypothetical protein